MTHDDDQTEGMDPLTREALGWIVRLTSGSATQGDARAFEAWRSQGPAHAAAFREAAAFRKTVRAMNLPYPAPAASNVVPIGLASRVMN